MVTGGSAHAQTPGNDTLKLSLKETEERFVNNNLALIIQRYEISQAQAQIITARLFNNPDFNIANGLYNPETKKYFDMSRNGGEYSAELSQLILTAGKRNKNIQLARINAEQATYQFYDLMRTLKYTLRSDFYKIYFQQQSAGLYQEEINSLSSTLAVFKEQYKKGNIAQKEVLRIQSQLYALQTEQNDLRDAMDDVQSELKLLIRVSPGLTIQPQISTGSDSKPVLENIVYQRLLDSAYTHRADLKSAGLGLEYSKLNLQLQKSMAIPDVSISLAYDKQGSYIRNYTSAGIAFSLPFFNRNQGAIRQARIAVDENKVQLQSQREQVESELDNSYKSALRLERLDSSFDPKFKADFNQLIGEVFKNYQRHNISLLEFLDFYESYKTNTLQFNMLQLNRLTALEQINFVTGTPFFNQ
ncbi:outer membrane protein, cobalt-zinc-cadmium efflux system [Mucilaginibacter pineti]|uniref:Outer membrane protein, cobalt-zinc-cadmium efflux system n=2 Tax=Mucilaginibacter pineti TaxID=1391627 RepID=A0A1G6U256_9SPHI|nr:outer membrane protein, cobalt-zinc-cadmium efflux system [Mucilaginibacter pineti]